MNAATITRSEAILNAADELERTLTDGTVSRRAKAVMGSSNLDAQQAMRYAISQILMKHFTTEEAAPAKRFTEDGRRIYGAGRNDTPTSGKRV